MGQNLKYLEFNKILIWPVIFYGRSRVQNHFFRNSHWRCSIKNGALKNFTKFTGKRLRQRLFFNKVAGTLAQAFSGEFCEIFKKNTCVRVSFLIKLQALQETLADTGVLL